MHKPKYLDKIVTQVGKVQAEAWTSKGGFVFVQLEKYAEAASKPGERDDGDYTSGE